MAVSTSEKEVGRDSDPQIASFCEQWLSFIKERKQIRVKIAG